MTKNELLEKLEEKPSWRQKEVIHLVSGINLKEVPRVSEIRVGDIIKNRFTKHPELVLKVTDDVAITCVLSTSHCTNMCKLETRFVDMQNSYVTYCTNVLKKETAVNLYWRTFDNLEQIQEIINCLKINMQILFNGNSSNGSRIRKSERTIRMETKSVGQNGQQSLLQRS